MRGGVNDDRQPALPRERLDFMKNKKPTLNWPKSTESEKCAAIAQHVMGWKRAKHGISLGILDPGWFYVSAKIGVSLSPRTSNGVYFNPLTSPADMMLVVERMKETQLTENAAIEMIFWNQNKQWACRLVNRSQSYLSTGTTLAEAVAKCALRSCGVEVVE